MNKEMRIQLEKETRIQRAIMGRYKGYFPLSEAFRDDADTVIENLIEDIKDNEIGYGDIEKFIHKALG